MVSLIGFLLNALTRIGNKPGPNPPSPWFPGPGRGHPSLPPCSPTGVPFIAMRCFTQRDTALATMQRNAKHNTYMHRNPGQRIAIHHTETQCSFHHRNAIRRCTRQWQTMHCDRNQMNPVQSNESQCNTMQCESTHPNVDQCLWVQINATRHNAKHNKLK